MAEQQDGTPQMREVEPSLSDRGLVEDAPAVPEKSSGPHNPLSDPQSSPGRPWVDWSLHLLGFVAGIGVAWGLGYWWADSLESQALYAGTMLDVFGLANVALGVRHTAKQFAGFGDGGLSMLKAAQLQLATATGGLKLEAVGLGWLTVGILLGNLSEEVELLLTTLGLTWPH